MSLELCASDKVFACVWKDSVCVRATELIRVVYEISEAGGQEGGQEGELAGDRRADGSAQQGNK